MPDVIEQLSAADPECGHVADPVRPPEDLLASIMDETDTVRLAAGASSRALHHPLLVAAVAAVVAVIALAPLALLRNGEPGSSTDADGPPAGVPTGAPAPGSVAPIVEAPPDWFGAPLAGERQAAQRTGRWVSTAIGINPGNGTVRSAISVAVTDGSLRGLDTADTVVIDGQTLQSLRFGEWHALATIEPPTIVVSGAVDTSVLAEVLQSVQVTTSVDGDALRLDHLPDGYAELVPPQIHAEDVANRRTFTNAAGDVAINEISDWVQPELAAAASGADYKLVAVGDSNGWTGKTEFNPYGPLTFLIWSPKPGVVLEIDTTNPDRTTEELIQLATLTRLLPTAEWDDILAN